MDWYPAMYVYAYAFYVLTSLVICTLLVCIYVVTPSLVMSGQQSNECV